MVAGNQTFPIYNSDGSSFNGLELKKSVYDSVVMSLGDKITGDVYYPNNALVVTMKEYIIYNGVKFVLVNPPTIVREGMVSDNGELKGMTKYSFTFYHPMYMLGNFPLCDVAVSSDQQRYLSENKTFFWIGNLTDFVAKLNKNLENTEWYCTINDSVSQGDRQRLSDVMSFDKNTIADALKTGYETWGLPYIVSIIPSTNPLYQQGKRFLIQYGLPSTEILVENEQHELVPFVFRFGQGVGLKNNSRTPRNNKIVTRIAGYGSEDNIQYGYPQIPYEGGDCEYPLYYGIVNGQRVQLIKHPFTRNHLMPSIYRETVNKKVNPMADGYNPDIEIIDYYDADGTYENPIKPLEPSYEIHEFEKIKPELGKRSIVGVSAYSNKDLDSISLSSFLSFLSEYHTETEYLKEKEELEKIINTIGTMSSNSGSVNTRAYYCDWAFTKDERYAYVKFESSALNFEYTVLMVSPSQDVEWDDTMDDDGKYVQSYFKITIPQLAFDLYASAAITQEMTINMRSGACLGCSFPVMVDWDDYKLNFFDSDGNFAPDGEQRDYDKYPDSSKGQIDLVLQKETSTFGTLMPNIYQKPKTGDEFVILGISLPTTYITEAEARLDAEMKQYMRDNNVYYFDYPLKFDEHFLTTHEGILEQMDNNVIVRFDYAGTEHALYIKQVSVKYDNKPLPTYDITLTDNIEVVLNQIGQVVDEVRRLHDNIGGIEVRPSDNYIRKDIDDTAYGTISLIKGLQVGNRFVTGLLGEGGVFRKEEDGTTYLECDKMYVRMKAYFDTVEVRHYMHSAGNRVASSAGIKCSRVEYIDANGDVTQDASNAQKYRCYFRANDDGQEVRNDFVVGDLAFCKETNAQTDSIEQHGYWRAVVGRNTEGVLTNDGEGWIDLSVSDCMQGSDIPIAQDDIIQLGNKTDTDRQGAIVEFVSGADAPSYQIYQGINDYSLNGKNYVRLGYDSASGGAQAYIGNPDGSTYLWYHNVTEESVTFPRLDIKANVRFTSPTTHQETTIQDFVGAVTSDIESLQSQIDGAIETWFYEHIPQLSNAPASDWKTDTEKKNHLGDLFYNTETGYGYRFANTGTEQSPVFGWIRITDTDVVKALADAAKAQDTADHKRRVFLTTPTPPYDAGDMWVNAVWPASVESQGSTYNNDILRCKTAKTSTQNFSINDWGLASKYTDDSALNYFIENTYAQDVEIISTQIDKKAETWYQDGDPSDAWTTDELKSEHVGDIWCDTSSNGGKKTWIYRDRGEGQDNRYYWAEQSVPDDVFDQIDGKADIFVSKPSAYNRNDLWIIEDGATSLPTGCKVGDIVIASNMPTGTDKRTKYTKADWVKHDRYTDDSKVNEIINKYGNILGITSPTAENVGEAVAYLDGILKHPAGTTIDGGLVLTSLIAMHGTESTPKVWGGMNGAYQSNETGTGYKGHGIAAWYGGAMVDHEVSTTATDYAKSLFRFDGSGYVAGGNLSWDKNGNVTLQGYSVNATTLTANGSAVATESMLAKYVTLATAQTISGKKTFSALLKATGNIETDTGNGAYIQIGEIRLVYDSANTAIKVVKSDGTTAANFYATGGVTALGAGSGGGDIVLAEPLSSINGAGLGTPKSANVGLVWNGSSWTYGAIGTGSGTVTAVKVGTTTYNPTNGVVSLPAYPTVPTKVSQLTNDSGFVTSSGVTNITLKAGTGISLDVDNTAITSTGTRTITNSGVRATTINGNYLRVNTNGTNADLTIPYATSARHFLAGQIGSANTSGDANTMQLDGEGTVYSVLTNYSSNTKWQNMPSSGVSSAYGGVVEIKGLDSSLKMQFAWYAIHNNETAPTVGLWFRSRANKGYVSTDWHQVAMTDSNVASATKLQTARTIWGQSFDGTANVSGDISNTGNITPSATAAKNLGSSTLMYEYGYIRRINTQSGYDLRIGAGGTQYIRIGASTGTVSISSAVSMLSTLAVTGLLTANGGITIPSGKTLKIGDAVLSWDSTNQGIKITKGLYSETFISAYGTGSSSGTASTLATLADVNVTGAKNDDVLTYNSTTKKWDAKAVQTGTDMATVWAELGASTTNQINASHLTNALGSYAQKTELAKYLPLTADADNRITGRLYLSRPISTTTEYTQTDNRIYYTTPDSEDEFLIRALIRNNGTNNYYRFFYITPFLSITSNDVAAGTQGYTTVVLGNSILITDANSKCGRIILYGKSNTNTTKVYYGMIEPTVFTANRTYTLPNASGTIALTSNLDGYLPLTGGTLTGALTINHNNGLVVQTDTGSSIALRKANGEAGEYLSVDVHDAKNNYTTSVFDYYTGNKNIVFGTHSTNMLNFYGQNAVFYTGTSYTGDSGTPYTERMRILKSGNVNIGDTPSADPGVKLNVDGDVKATKFIGALQGNADSATTASKLSVVSKKAWGQTYWTSGGVPTTISGNMTNVGSITMSGAITGATTISASSNVSVGGTLSVTGLLTASGGIKIPSGKTLQIGDAVLSWDSSNQGIKITKGLYSKTFISAYGSGSDSGAATSLSSLSDVNTSGVANGMALVYRSGTWRAETISSGTSGNYLPLSGGTMTGNIITPANNSLGIRPASNNYGQIGTSSYKFYRMYASNMYASTFYGELDGTISDETRGSLITSNNEFNFVPQVYTRDDLHFNYKAANGELCNRTISTYCFDDGKNNTLCSITSSGASAGSDIRKKDVKEYFRLRLDDIVSAPLIRFSWKNMNDKSLQVGSIAQYWKDVLPESVIEGTDGYLFMNDAKVALACSISLASNVQDHERRIAELEKENERLRTEIEQLKIA